MEDGKLVMVVMMAIAIYKKRSLRYALDYLVTFGFTEREALDMLNTYNKCELVAERGLY